MTAGKWGLVLLATAILVYAVIRGVQGSGPSWATAVAMLLILVSTAWSNRKTKGVRDPRSTGSTKPR